MRATTELKNEISTLEIIQQIFPNQIRLSTASVARLFDYAEQSIRNAIAAGTFPIRSYKDGSLRFFDIRDIASHIENKRDGHAAKKTTKVKTKPGRPTKAVSMAKAAAAKRAHAALCSEVGVV